MKYLTAIVFTNCFGQTLASYFFDLECPRRYLYDPSNYHSSFLLILIFVAEVEVQRTIFLVFICRLECDEFILYEIKVHFLVSVF